jgi:hypothetical protein
MDDTARPSGLIPSDDLTLHQTAETFQRTDTLHPKWTERWYFNLQDGDGRLLGICGGGFYPFSGVLDVYACLLSAGQQHNLRQRVRAVDRGRLDAAEQVRFTIVDAMQTWHASATCPAFALELRFQAGHVAHLFPPFVVAADRPDSSSALEFDAIQHFVQPGQASGELRVGSAPPEPFDARSFRDRTWGVRSARPRLHNWFVFHADEGQYVTLIHQERANGTPMVSHMAVVAADGSARTLVLDEHDLTFHPRTRLLLAARYRGHDAAGRRVQLMVENIGDGVRLLGAGYTSAQGDASAEEGVVSETWDLGDADLMTRMGRGTIDSPASMVLHCGDGVPLHGVGVTESAIARNHWRYGSQIM